MLTEEEIQELLAKNPNQCKYSKHKKRMKFFRFINIVVLVLSVLFILLCVWNLIGIHYGSYIAVSSSIAASFIFEKMTDKMQLAIVMSGVGISAVGIFLMALQMSVFDRWMTKEYER